MTHFLVLCYLGFGELIPTSGWLSLPSSPTRPLPTCFPPRHLQSRLVSPPQSSPSHGMHGVEEAPESTMPHCASGEVSEEPTTTSSQAAIDTQPARMLLNTASQSHLSHCVKQSSIHPPDKIHNYPSPSPWSVKFVSPNSTPTFPCRSAPYYTPEKSPRRVFFLFFLNIFYGWKDRWRLCISMGILNNACFAPIATTTNKSNSHR